MKTITILYFGRLRQLSGMAEETIQTEAESPVALLGERSATHGFQCESSSLRFALNEDFCCEHDALSDGDTLAFMPPMAGG